MRICATRKTCCGSLFGMIFPWERGCSANRLCRGSRCSTGRVALCIYSVPDKYQLVNSGKIQLLYSCPPGWQTWEPIQYLIMSVKQRLQWGLRALVRLWSRNQAVYLEMFHMVSCTSPVDAQKMYVFLENRQALQDFTPCLVLFGSQRNWENNYAIAACQHLATSVGAQACF